MPVQGCTLHLLYRRLEDGNRAKFTVMLVEEGYKLENSSCDIHINGTNCCKNIPVPYEYPIVPHESVGRLKAAIAQ